MDGTSVSPEAQLSPLEELKWKLSEADGSLIPLSKVLPSGERIFVSVRDGDYERVDFHAEIEYGEEIPKVIEPAYLIEVYAGESEEKVKPVGHWDWYIDGDTARGSGNMHKVGITYVDFPWHALADERWKNDSYSALKLEDEYRGAGLGNLLVAISAVVMKDRAKYINTGVLLDPATRTLQGFGLEKGNIFQTEASAFASHPKINQVLQNFL